MNLGPRACKARALPLNYILPLTQEIFMAKGSSIQELNIIYEARKVCARECALLKSLEKKSKNS